jgi:hypothetical protein
LWDSTVPENESWENAYVIQGADGSIWQRAIVSNKGQKIILKEGEAVDISGVGQPNTQVQAFLFHPEFDDSGVLTNRPSTGSTCLNIGTSDPNGYFSFGINAQHLWENIGQEMIIDAYTRLEKSWDQYVEENDNQNFYIGTNLPMGRLSIEVEKATNTEGCTILCEDNETILAHKLVPTAESEAFAPLAFDEVGNKNVNIGRTPGEHTFYAGVEGETDNTQFDIRTLQSYGMRTVHAEYLKRRLLGNPNASGVVPGLTEISVASLEEAASDAGPASSRNRELVKNIKNAMMNVDRNVSLKKLEHKGDRFSTQYFDNLLPDNATETDWAQTFVDVLTFWSGGVEQNKCLIKDDDKIYLNTWDRIGIAIPCGEVLIQGSSPTIALYTQEEVSLEPDFSDVQITYADTAFTGKNDWSFPEGEKEPLYYRYEFMQDYDGNVFPETSCVSPESLDEYVNAVSESFGLTSDESEIVQNELSEAVSFDGLYSVSVADPKDIAKRFSWKVNGETAQIPQLFFDVQEDSCAIESINIPSAKLDTNRIGFETGLLQ